MRKFTARTALATGVAALAMIGVGAAAAVAATDSGSTAATHAPAGGNTLAAVTEIPTSSTTPPAPTSTHKCPADTAAGKVS